MSARSVEESVVINAGSSSLKFSLFRLRRSDLALDLRGQIEGIGIAPRFVARDASGRTVAEQSWSEQLGDAGAVEHVRAFLRERLAGDRLVGGGHRVVHGGLEYAAPIRVDRGVLEALERLSPLAPLHQPHILSPISISVVARASNHRNRLASASRWMSSNRRGRAILSSPAPDLTGHGNYLGIDMGIS